MMCFLFNENSVIIIAVNSIKIPENMFIQIKNK